MIQSSEAIFYSLLFLLPIIVLSGLQIALELLGSLKGKEELQKKNHLSYLFFFTSFYPTHLWKSLHFSIRFVKLLYYTIFLFALFSIFFVHATYKQPPSFELFISLEIIFILFLSIFLDFLLLLAIRHRPEKTLQLLCSTSCLLMLPCTPFLFLHFKIKQLFSPKQETPQKLPFRLQDNIIDHLSDSDLGRYLDKTETKLIHTVLSFKDRIVREVIVPRIDVFSLPVETTIKEAARLFSIEGYSRIPVYKESVDKIIGVLLYKDVLSVYTKHIENNEPESELHKTVEQLIKPAIYTPETKKIAGLLQEFRNKQIHLAIVVDEYGGTEGIVTIEDILEELVGEIEDEYDTQETKIYFPLSSGGWIVDAKIGIITLEEELNVKIPQSPEYDTIGGFIFHRTGSIPNQGWKVHLDDVDLEILTSDERSIQKVKITPVSPKHKKHS
ncbi:MAG: hemolysin family protein [Chlamydiota bacterium]